MQSGSISPRLEQIPNLVRSRQLELGSSTHRQAELQMSLRGPLVRYRQPSLRLGRFGWCNVRKPFSLLGYFTNDTSGTGRTFQAWSSVTVMRHGPPAFV